MHNSLNILYTQRRTLYAGYAKLVYKLSKLATVFLAMPDAVRASFVLHQCLCFVITIFYIVFALFKHIIKESASCYPNDMKNDSIEKYKDEFIAIGIRIGYLRRLKGMTQEQLAEKAGISMGFLSQVEAPNMAVGISLATLFSIAGALGVKPSKLLEIDAVSM